MKELFAVDPTTLIVLVALLVFVVFVVIYKSRQNSTTYYSGEFSSDDIEDVRDYQEEKFKKSKSKREKNTVDYGNPTSQSDKDAERKVWATIDCVSIVTITAILSILVLRKFSLPQGWHGSLSFVISIVLYYGVVKPTLFNTKGH